VTGRDVRFRPMTAADLPLLHAWLERPHVKRWYADHGGYDDVVAHYGPSLDGRDPTDHYIVQLGERPVGMVQTYVVVDHPRYAALIGVRDPYTAGADILVGEEELTGQGLGTQILRCFVEEIVFARATTTRCVADPDVDNTASVRAFEKAGFHRLFEFVDPDDGRPHVLLERRR
jgi:RimJ/RimL family protein N-acetyltransferase